MRAEDLLRFCVVICVLHVAMARHLQTASMEPDREEADEYLTDENRWCKKCPAGSYVSEHCTIPRTEGTCRPCENGTLSKLLNPLDSCFPCRVCRNLDQVEIKKCTATTDTECACKEGTFCPPNEPCETCRKCTQSCPLGETKVQNCTPTSNIWCLPASNSSAPTSSTPTSSTPTRLPTWLWILVILLLVGLLILVLCWKKNQSFRKACSDVWRCTRRSNQEQNEVHDNMLNGQLDQRSSQHLLSNTPPSTAAPKTAHPLTAFHLEEEDQASAAGRQLVPANGMTSTEEPVAFI